MIYEGQKFKAPMCKIWSELQFKTFKKLTNIINRVSEEDTQDGTISRCPIPVNSAQPLH